MNTYYGFIFFTPAFFANSAAVFVSGLGRVDRGKTFRGKPILGTNKTNGGVLGATIGGGLLAIAVTFFFPEIFAQVDGYHWALGFLLGFGAIVGDAVGSFLKRRLEIKPGGPFPVMDQVGFVIFAYLFSLIFVKLPLGWLMVIPFTLVLHLAANMIAYNLGWKDVWW